MFIRLLIFSLMFSITAHAKPFCFDDDSHNLSHSTKNDMGKSSYHCSIAGGILKILLKNDVINNKDTALDFGAGYGCVTYELTELGFKNIMASDLEVKNLQCLQQHQHQHHFPNKPIIKLLKGDILHDGQYESMKNGSLGLVYARHVIHLMNGSDIIKLLKISHQKLKNKGIVVLEYENNKRNELSEMIFMMSNEIKADTHDSDVESLELKVVKKYYENSACSFNDYLKVNSKYRVPGFPCQYHTFLKTNQKPIVYHYIDQNRLIDLLVKLNFKVLEARALDNHVGTGIVIAQKNRM